MVLGKTVGAGRKQWQWEQEQNWQMRARRLGGGQVGDAGGVGAAAQQRECARQWVSQLTQPPACTRAGHVWAEHFPQCCWLDLHLAASLTLPASTATIN